MSTVELKDLSARAAPYLSPLEDRREQFLADGDGDELAGTIMVGSMSCGEEPEWSEEPAWHALEGMVLLAFTIFDDETPNGRLGRDLSTPDLIFAAADDLLVQMKAAS